MDLGINDKLRKTVQGLPAFKAKPVAKVVNQPPKPLNWRTLSQAQALRPMRNKDLLAKALFKCKARGLVLGYYPGVIELLADRLADLTVIDSAEVSFLGGKGKRHNVKLPPGVARERTGEYGFVYTLGDFDGSDLASGAIVVSRFEHLRDYLKRNKRRAFPVANGNGVLAVRLE